MTEPTHRPRRDFLVNGLLAITVIPGFGLAVRHVLRYLVPARLRQEKEVLVGKLGKFPTGSSRVLHNVYGNDLIAVRVSEREVRVFSSICTHLGCAVHWDAQAGNFLCPCHMGRFDTSGQVIAGPPPTPLPAFPTRLDADSIFVTVPVKEA